jgi:hypothetical protein
MWIRLADGKTDEEGKIPEPAPYESAAFLHSLLCDIQDLGALAKPAARPTPGENHLNI